MEKDNLKQELLSYKDVVTSDIINYLNALIDLDISVISSRYIDEEKRKALSKLEIYEKIKLYNIFYKTTDTLKKNSIGYFSDIKDYDKFKIYAISNNQSLLVFSANLSLVKGYIDLYEQAYNMNIRKKALEKVVNDLKELKKYNCNNKNYYEIKKLEKLMDELEEPHYLSYMDYNNIELSTKVFQLLLDDYNLSYKDFNEEVKTVKDKYMSRTLVLKKDDINIYRNIKYL